MNTVRITTLCFVSLYLCSSSVMGEVDGADVMPKSRAPGCSIRFFEMQTHSSQWSVWGFSSEPECWYYKLGEEIDNINYDGWSDNKFHEVLEEYCNRFAVLAAYHKPTGIIKIARCKTSEFTAGSSVVSPIRLPISGTWYEEKFPLRYWSPTDAHVEVATIYPHAMGLTATIELIEYSTVGGPNLCLTIELSGIPGYPSSAEIKPPEEDDSIIDTGQRCVVSVAEVAEVGVMFDAYSLENTRNGAGKPKYPTQDRFVSQCVGDWYFCGVFDGHGGHGVAHYLADKKDGFVARLGKQFASACDKPIDRIIKDVCFELWRGILISQSSSDSTAGSTACVAAYNQKMGLFKIINIGDSGARVHIINSDGQKGVFTTTDQTPKSMEKKINMRGGYLKGERVKGGLGVGAAFGDYWCKGIAAEPDITTIPLVCGETIALVVATDGFWDMVSSCTTGLCMDFFELLHLEKVPLKGVSNWFAKFADAKWNGKADDITVIYTRFHHECSEC